MGGCVGGLAGRADGGAGPIPLAPRDARPPRAGGARPGGARYGGPGPSGSGGRKGPSAGLMGRTGSAPRSLAGEGVREPGCGSGAAARPRSGTAGADGAWRGPRGSGSVRRGAGSGAAGRGSSAGPAGAVVCPLACSAGTALGSPATSEMAAARFLGLSSVRAMASELLDGIAGSAPAPAAAGVRWALAALSRRRVRPLPAAGCGYGRQREIPRPRWQGSVRWLVAVRQPRVVALDRHWRARRIGQARSPAPRRCGGGWCRSDPGLRIGPL